MLIDFLIIGAGGHATVVYDAIIATSPDARVAVCDENSAAQGSVFLDIAVQAPIDWTRRDYDSFHVAIGNNSDRRRCHNIALQSGRLSKMIKHPLACVSVLANIGEGTFIAAGAIVGPRSTLGLGVIVNHGAVVDHDCKIGDFSHIAPNVTLSGGVEIDSGVLVGAGAIVLPRRKIGANAIIGAGSVVTNDVAAGETVVGAPARTMRKT